jgi:hypothetical protein
MVRSESFIAHRTSFSFLRPCGRPATRHQKHREKMLVPDALANLAKAAIDKALQGIRSRKIKKFFMGVFFAPCSPF